MSVSASRPEVRGESVLCIGWRCVPHAASWHPSSWLLLLVDVARVFALRDQGGFSRGTHFSLVQGEPALHAQCRERPPAGKGAPLGLHSPRSIQTGCPVTSIRLLGKPHRKKKKKEKKRKLVDTI